MFLQTAVFSAVDVRIPTPSSATNFEENALVSTAKIKFYLYTLKSNLISECRISPNLPRKKIHNIINFYWGEGKDGFKFFLLV